METVWREALWRQFDAAIETLERAIVACPDELWQARIWEEPEIPAIGEVWNVAFHTLFWMDYYLSGSEEGFAPPAPFTLNELDPQGQLPDRVYTKEELRTYLAHCRAKSRAAILGLDDTAAARRCGFGWLELNYVELILYNLRHIQEHAVQINLLLGQRTGNAPDWVAWTEPKE